MQMSHIYLQNSAKDCKTIPWCSACKRRETVLHSVQHRGGRQKKAVARQTLSEKNSLIIAETIADNR